MQPNPLTCDKVYLRYQGFPRLLKVKNVIFWFWLLISIYNMTQSSCVSGTHDAGNRLFKTTFVEFIAHCASLVEY